MIFAVLEVLLIAYRVNTCVNFSFFYICDFLSLNYRKIKTIKKDN